eukprot:9824369-Ditylum_brightwellii.AAC.1
MTRRAWRTKSKQNVSKIKPVVAPGDCVLVDQLKSGTPGFVAQFKGRLTKKRYRAVTIFIDHFSDLTYIYEQSRLTSKETVAAKAAFETFACNKDVLIKHYHADNGRFADNAFVRICIEKGQTLSYCAANFHFQNGQAEKRIQDIQEHARKGLLHGQSRWPEA